MSMSMLNERINVIVKSEKHLARFAHHQCITITLVLNTIPLEIVSLPSIKSEKF